MRRLCLVFTFLLSGLSLSAKSPSTAPGERWTATSLFLKSDKVQVGEIASEEGNMYKKVGHHGPAVENRFAAFRIYFNDSGAVDVYSKSGKQMELLKYLWYPSEEQMLQEGAGCDEYRVGKTVGLGGIALWDPDKGEEVKLAATRGRTARVGDTARGSFAEMISYGVPYMGRLVDISIRIDVRNDSRFARVTARSLDGSKVRFLTGVNYHQGELTGVAPGRLWAWGVHPADVSEHPVPIGGGMYYRDRIFPRQDKTDDMLRIISVPRRKVHTLILTASTKETELGTQEAFSAMFDR